MNRPSDMVREIAELEQGMRELGIIFDRAVIDKFNDYLQLLHASHGKFHLISHLDHKRVSRRHFLPSLVALRYVEKHNRVCDIGSGAGFPSIPLKILIPHLDLVIFESQRKKADFLERLIDALRLERAEVVNSRAEDYSGRRFDLGLLKAVGTIKKFVRLLDSILEADGEAIFYKTFGVEEELKIARGFLNKLRFTAEVMKTHTPLEKRPLALVILRKGRMTG